MDFYRCKIIVNENEHTIVHVAFNCIEEGREMYLITEYDNDSPVHRLRELLPFDDIKDAIKYVKELNNAYDIIEEDFEEPEYY